MELKLTLALIAAALYGAIIVISRLSARRKEQRRNQGEAETAHDAGWKYSNYLN